MNVVPKLGQMSSAGPSLVLIGHVAKEMIYTPEQTQGPVLGGPVAYGSILAAALGERVGIVTTVGTDMPHDLLQVVLESGMDITGLNVRDGNYTTSTELVYDDKGKKHIRYPQKAPAIRFEDIPKAYHSAKIIYIAAFDWDVPIETIKKLSSLDVTLAIDLGGYGGAHSREHPNEAEQNDPEKLRELVSNFDIVRASWEDCEHLLGISQDGMQYSQDDLVRVFVEWGASIGLVTLGEAGCIIGTSNGVVRIPAQDGQAVDTTGAGDAFSSAFLIAYIHTTDLEWSARFASAAVMHVIERTGGVSATRMPTRHEVERRLKYNNN